MLPPDLRPIALRDGEWLMSDLNCHYQRVILRNGRLRRLQELNAPSPLIAEERLVVERSLAALLDNERLSDPICDDHGRILVSLRGLLGPDVNHTLQRLDDAVAKGCDLGQPLPLPLHRIVATLFALGVEVTAG